jgi:hypothetical protein
LVKAGLVKKSEAGYNLAVRPNGAEDKPAKARGGAATDQFGCRLGSQAAKINELLLRHNKPVTVKEVAEATRLAAGRVYSHLQGLVKKGFVGRNAEGFYVKAQARK